MLVLGRLKGRTFSVIEGLLPSRVACAAEDSLPLALISLRFVPLCVIPLGLGVGKPSSWLASRSPVHGKGR